jgi:hypothetical protein
MLLNNGTPESFQTSQTSISAKDAVLGRFPRSPCIKRTPELQTKKGPDFRDFC